MRRSTSVAETDDHSLSHRAAAGDRTRSACFTRRYAPSVFRHAYFLTGDPILAEDLTAQTFLKALEAMPRYEERGVPFIAWLLRITCNLAINHKKAHKNNGHAQLPETLEADEARSARPKDRAEVKLDGQRVWTEGQASFPAISARSSSCASWTTSAIQTSPAYSARSSAQCG